MTIDHDKDLGQDAQGPGTPRWRLAQWLLAGALVTPLGVGGAAWLARKPIAHAALQSWCGGRNLICDARFDRIGPGRIVLSDLTIASGASVPFEAGQIDARLTWSGLLSPGASVVTIDSPVLRARLDGSRISLDGLERLAPAGGGGGQLPEVNLTNGRLVLSTPAGEVYAGVTASGTYPEAGQLDIIFEPAALSSPQGAVDLGPSSASLTATEGRLSGTVVVQVNSASFGDTNLTDANLRADITGVSGGRSETRIEWTAALQSASASGAVINGLDATGHAELARLDGDTPGDFLAALTQARFDAAITDVKTSAYGSGPATLTADLTGTGGRIAGPVTLSAGSVSAPEGTARTFGFDGEASREGNGVVAVDGTVSVEGASLSPDLRTNVLEPLALPGALAAHGLSLRRAFDRGLDDLNAVVRVQASRTDGNITLAAFGDTSLSAASGLDITLRPDGTSPWLSIARGTQSLGGALTVSGGGAPSVRARIDKFYAGSGEFALAARGVSIAPWTASGLTVSSSLSALDVAQAAGSLRFAGNGRLTLAGDVAGARLQDTALTGGLEAVTGEAGWQVRSIGRPCLALSSEGVSVGVIAVSPVKTDLCASNGEFVRTGSKVAAGSVTLGDVQVPFTMSSGAGTLGLEGAAIDWNASQGLRLLVRADTMDLPLQIGERTLTIAGEAPRFDVRTGTGPARLAATLEATVFGGTLIPAKVSAGAFRFDGTNTRAGISGDLSASGVLIEDFRDDPLYRPMRTDLTATIADNQLKMSGPLRVKTGRLATTERIVADSAVEIDIIKLDGSASVRSRDITFRPGSIQPEDLSGRLLGVFTSATGTLDAAADFTIRSGQIAGTSDISVTDFGFLTTRLGRVTDVDGRVRFSDVMTLTTPPGQEVTIGSVHPGVTLSGGRIVFGLENGSLLNIESGRFPFAGGFLSVQPLAWMLGGGDQRVEVTASGVQLAELVEILKLPDTNATGTVGGSFPIDFEGANVFVRDARLKAEAPGGRLSYVGGILDKAAEQDPTARLAFDALKDFEFTVLEIGLSGNTTGRMNASMQLAGVNLRPVPLDRRLTIPPGQAFEFNIAFDVPFQQMFTDTINAFDQQKLIETVVRMREEEQEAASPEAATE